MSLHTPIERTSAPACAPRLPKDAERVLLADVAKGDQLTAEFDSETAGAWPMRDRSRASVVVEARRANPPALCRVRRRVAQPDIPPVRVGPPTILRERSAGGDRRVDWSLASSVLVVSDVGGQVGAQGAEEAPRDCDVDAVVQRSTWPSFCLVQVTDDHPVGLERFQRVLHGGLCCRQGSSKIADRLVGLGKEAAQDLDAQLVAEDAHGGRHVSTHRGRDVEPGHGSIVSRYGQSGMCGVAPFGKCTYNRYTSLDGSSS